MKPRRYPIRTRAERLPQKRHAVLTAAIGVPVLFGAGLAIGKPRLEADLERQAHARLAAAGIEGVTVTAEWLDIVATDQARPRPGRDEAVRRALKGVSAAQQISVRNARADSPVTAVRRGRLVPEITVRFDGVKATLSGRVRNEKVRAELVESLRAEGILVMDSIAIGDGPTDARLHARIGKTIRMLDQPRLENGSAVFLDDRVVLTGVALNSVDKAMIGAAFLRLHPAIEVQNRITVASPDTAVTVTSAPPHVTRRSTKARTHKSEPSSRRRKATAARNVIPARQTSSARHVRSDR